MKDEYKDVAFDAIREAHKNIDYVFHLTFAYCGFTPVHLRSMLTVARPNSTFLQIKQQLILFSQKQPA